MIERVSLVFPAYNRLEFTQQSWFALMANTDWSLVEEFHIYDDGSTDGTCGFLEEQIDWHFNRPLRVNESSTKAEGVAVHFHQTEFRSPVGLTIDWIKRSRAPLLAKLDNDTIYPPGWLNESLSVMQRNPKLDLLGLECMRKPVPVTTIGGSYLPAAEDDGSFRPNGAPITLRSFLPARFVSGLGIYRASAFTTMPREIQAYFGFEEWMQEKRRVCGWILPSLPVFLLDRMCTEPWASLSDTYIDKGWQRKHGQKIWRYKPEQSDMWSWWKPVDVSSNGVHA